MGHLVQGVPVVGLCVLWIGFEALLVSIIIIIIRFILVTVGLPLNCSVRLRGKGAIYGMCYLRS